jgi:hypothetical protein
MNSTLHSTKSAASTLGFHYLKVLNRAEILSLEPIKQNTTFYWTEDQIHQIKLYSETRKQRKDSVSRFQPENIKIIEMFLSQNNNSMTEIQKTIHLPLNYISKVINYYLENKCVIVESKMNSL